MTPGPGDGLALFGGAFNPPHLTHRRIIEASMQQLPVSRVIVLPAGAHPHKQDEDSELAPADDRLELCRLAFGDLPGVVIDDREVRRPGLSYTVDTLREFRVEAPDTPLYFLIGSDNLPLLDTWREPDAIRSLCSIVTYPRLHHPVDQTQVEQVLTVEPDNVSATSIRAALRAGEEPASLDPRVLAEIRTRGLYQT